VPTLTLSQPQADLANPMCQGWLIIIFIPLTFANDAMQVILAG